MSKELIIKLVKLANNNPNTNEANAAARKVCKLLEENGFKVLQEISTTKTPNFTPNVNSEDILEQIRRMQEEQFRKGYQQQQQQYNPFYNWGSPRQQKPKKDLKCTKCGTTVNSAYIGHPGTFVCNPCIWSAYQESR